ncbi:hypothetical protein B7463_g10651, partial [Scytalidium lignicola]
MDSLPPLGRGTAEVLVPTYKIYGELLQQPSNSSAILGKEYQTYSYGSHERQKLDLYIPSSSVPMPAAGISRPIFVFFYGGGLVTGDRILSNFPGGLVYRNIGYFFSEVLGFETIIADYRLLGKGGKAPSGREDVDGVVQWIKERYGLPDKPRDLFIMATSAGGYLLATWPFNSDLHQKNTAIFDGKSRVHLRGIIFLGTPFDLNVAAKISEEYYGSVEQARADQPLVRISKIQEGLNPEDLSKWPRILVLVSELDSEDFIVEAGKRLVNEWGRSGAKIEFAILEGHNHISPPVDLGSDIERKEAWGFGVGEWIKSGLFSV